MNSLSSLDLKIVRVQESLTFVGRPFDLATTRFVKKFDLMSVLDLVPRRFPWYADGSWIMDNG